METKRPSKEILEKMYWENGMSIYEIAEEIGVSKSTVSNFLHYYGIPIRSMSQRGLFGTGQYDVEIPPKSLLEQYYLQEKMTQQEIADILKVSQRVLRGWFSAYNIPTRSVSERLHIRQANHIALSDEARQFIDGDLLGDGGLRGSSVYSAALYHSQSSRGFSEWLVKKLEGFGFEIPNGIQKIITYRKGKRLFSYRFITRFYVELRPLLKRFYPNGEKIVPPDIDLSPLSVLLWYLGDGGMSRIYSAITLATCCFSMSDIELLRRKLQKIGFDARYVPSNNLLSIKSASVADFLTYIGDYPIDLNGVYDYKFQPNLSSRVRQYSPGENPGALTIL